MWDSHGSGEPFVIMGIEQFFQWIKIQENLIADNDEKLRDFIKDGFKTIDALDKLGVGNQDAARQLLEALSKKPEDVGVVSPKPMSVEQLEDMFLENQKPPTPK